VSRPDLTVPELELLIRALNIYIDWVMTTDHLVEVIPARRLQKRFERELLAEDDAEAFEREMECRP